MLLQSRQCDQMLENKVAQQFPNVAEIISTAVLHKLTSYKIAQKSPILLGVRFKQICWQKLSKIAQSGHTGHKNQKQLPIIK